MVHETRLEIPAQRVRSLCWHGDRLVDWVGGNAWYGLDGSCERAHVNWAYTFDAAVMSPSGEYAAIYQRLGTKGLLLQRGKALRELNRSFYWAHMYDYPIALFALPDGREVMAHCPDSYARIDIEESATGRRLTERSRDDLADFFHSELTANATSTFLLSAGWIWQPFQTLRVFSIQSVLSSPSLLNRSESSLWQDVSLEVENAAFLDADQIIVASSKEAESLEDDDQALPRTPGTIAVFNLAEQRLESVAPLQETAGTLLPIGPTHVVGFYEYPKLIELTTGRIVHRWPDLNSGTKLGCIAWNRSVPPMALDAANRRFAIATDSSIKVVTIHSIEGSGPVEPSQPRAHPSA